MRILGVQIDGSYLRAAVLEVDRKKIKVVALKNSLTKDPQNVKELYIPSFPGTVVSAIAANKGMLRPLELTLPKNRYTEEILSLQAESISYFKPQDMIAVFELKGQKGPKTQFILHVVLKEEVKNTLLDLQKLNLDPEFLSFAPVALFHYARWKFPELKDAFLIHLGNNEWVCSLVEKGILKKTQSIGSGNDGLLSALLEDRKKNILHKEVEAVAKQIDLLHLKSHLNPHLSNKLNEMKQELSKIIFSFYREGGAKPYFFTGSVDTFGHYCDFLKEGFQDAISSEIKGDGSLEELKFAVPIGLGLEQTNSHPLQLRRGEFFPRKNWQQSGLYALVLICISFVLSVFLLISGQKIEAIHKNEMERQLSVLLAKTDPKLKEKLFSTQQETLLYDWIDAVELYSKNYPFISTAPKVVELLSWISSHPLLEKLKTENTPILIRDLRYQLVQYPHVGSTEEPYQTKVEVEFEANSPMNARKFHQALLKGDSLVDAKQEIGWEVLANGYRASFFLKNRTPDAP